MNSMWSRLIIGHGSGVRVGVGVAIGVRVGVAVGVGVLVLVAVGTGVSNGTIGIRLLVIVQVRFCPTLSVTLPVGPHAPPIWTVYCDSTVPVPAVSLTTCVPAGSVTAPVVPLWPTFVARIVPSLSRFTNQFSVTGLS